MSITNPIENSTSRPTIAILGVPFDSVTTAEAEAAIEQMALSERPHYIVTANVDFLVQAREDIELRRILFDAHLVLCDGTPLVWASQLLGNPLPERVAGSDLVPLLARRAEENGLRLFFLGGLPEVLDQALAKLRRRHPRLSVSGYSPPHLDLLEMDHEEIKRRIKEAAPQILLVCFGCPKQEKWIAMHYKSLGVPVAIGVGGTLSFLAGTVRRAPLWMQRTGTEWLFRIMQEPRRLTGRYARGFWIFGATIFRQWWRLQLRGSRRQPARSVAPVKTEPSQLHAVAGSFDLAAIDHQVLSVDAIMEDGRHCLLDLAGVDFIDSSGVGLLIRLQKKSRAAGRYLILVAPSQTVRRALAQMRLTDFFDVAPDAGMAQRLLEARASEQSRWVAPDPTKAVQSLVWRGEITAEHAEDVWRVTETQVLSASAAGRNISIDLSEVRFIDSTGLSVMIRVRKLALRQALKLDFTNPSGPVRNVMRMSRLEAFLLGDTK